MNCLIAYLIIVIFVIPAAVSRQSVGDCNVGVAVVVVVVVVVVSAARVHKWSYC